MSEVKQDQKTAKFFLDDNEVPPYPLRDFEGNTYYPIEGEREWEGKWIYETTERFAAHMVLTHGKFQTIDGKPKLLQKRYKLIGQKILDAEYRTPQGAVIWTRIVPFNRKKVTQAVLVDGNKQKYDDNGKAMTEWVFILEEYKPATKA